MIRKMASLSKRAPPAKRRPQAKPPAKRAAPPRGPFLRFYHSEGLRKKTLALLATIEQSQDATRHRDALTDLVMELTSSGMDAYFMQPLRLTKMGFLVEQSANLGLTSVQQVMGSVIRQVIGRMDSAQVLSVCGSIRQFML